jgi:hypothetical protein
MTSDRVWEPCPVCQRPMDGLVWCSLCSKAYERANLHLTHDALIRWVATRARRFAKREMVRVDAKKASKLTKLTSTTIERGSASDRKAAIEGDEQ